MHIVLVLVTVKPDMLEEFERALLHNARESVKRDPGCLRFDVSQQVDDPARWLLYEAYEAPAAHAAHRESPHFLAYDAVAARAVIDKTVIKASTRHFTAATYTADNHVIQRRGVCDVPPTPMGIGGTGICPKRAQNPKRT